MDLTLIGCVVGSGDIIRLYTKRENAAHEFHFGNQ